MSTPGFAAEYSLYKSRVYYYTVAALAQGAGAIAQQFSLPVSVGMPLREMPLVPGGSTCDPLCHLDDAGACVRDCIYCTPHQPIDQCQEFTEPCPPSACCPAGQDACYAAHKPQFCCPPDKPSCCNSEANLCFGPGQQCCGDHLCAASENCCTIPGAPVGCCPADQACTLQGCCSQQNVPCGDQCCALALPGADPACCNGTCVDKKTDPYNCGGCGKTYLSLPPHAAPICVNGQPNFACNDAGWPTKCVNTCCPRGMDCCQNQCTDTMTDLHNCGRCGNDCVKLAPPNSRPKCVNGACGFDCLPGAPLCGNLCCSPDRCINGVCCPSNRVPCNVNGQVCCPQGQLCSEEDTYTGGCCPPSQYCLDASGTKLCCPASLPSSTGGSVPVGCGSNKQCICLNGGTILNGVCMGGGGPTLHPFNFAVTCGSGFTATCSEVTQYAENEAEAEMIVQNNFANCDVVSNGSCPS
jgi:hypothetical protein